MPWLLLLTLSCVSVACGDDKKPTPNTGGASGSANGGNGSKTN